MTDAVSDMLGGTQWSAAAEIPQEEFPEVTAIIRYDLYPYYFVVKGLLQKDGGLRSDMMGSFKTEAVLKVFPAGAYKAQESLLKRITSSYREKELELRIDILKQHGVDFVQVTK